MLVVDDSDDDAHSLVRCVVAARPSSTVTRVASVEEALRVCRGEPAVDVIVAEDQLPDGTGADLAAGLRGVAPVIVVTGHEAPGQSARMLAVGATDYIVKSELATSSIGRVLDTALVRHDLERELAAAREAQERALAEERALTERMRALLDLTSGLSAASTTDELAAFVVSRVGTMLSAVAVSFYAVVGSELSLRAHRGIRPEVAERFRTIPIAAPTPLAEAARTGLLAHATSAQLASQLDTITPDRTWLAVPIRGDTTTFAVLGLGFDSNAAALDAELDHLLLVASVIAQAMRRARLLELASANAEFEERLLAVLGHDLRSPLEVILLGVALLRSGNVAESTLARVERAAHRMSGLITDILARAAARRGAGGRGADIQPVGEILFHQVSELRDARPDRQLTLTLAPALDAHGDAVRISQIVMNLVRNAQTHGAPDQPVDVRAEAVGGQVRIVVANRGPAIPEGLRARMFQPFQRGERSTGTGLGLFIVHEAVDALGGTIAVTSDDSLTQFIVELPAVAAP